MADARPPKSRCQVCQASIATGAPPVPSSSGAKLRPSAGATCRNCSSPRDTNPTSIVAGAPPRTVRLRAAAIVSMRSSDGVASRAASSTVGFIETRIEPSRDSRLTTTSRSTPGYGSGAMSIRRNTLARATVAPMPTPRVATVVSVKSGARSVRRTAYATSARSAPSASRHCDRRCARCSVWRSARRAASTSPNRARASRAASSALRPYDRSSCSRISRWKRSSSSTSRAICACVRVGQRRRRRQLRSESRPPGRMGVTPLRSRPGCAAPPRRRRGRCAPRPPAGVVRRG